MRPRVLVTGFGPFPGAPRNPSQALVEGLRGALDGTKDYALHLAVLPTRYDAARERLLALHRRLRPDIALHFGVDLKASGFTLERVARNRLAPGRLDAAGGRPARAAIRAGGPLACPSSLPLKRIHAALSRRGLPAALSDDAGAYVCNLAFYAAAARRPGRQGRAMAGFIHIPLIAEMTRRPAQRARAGRAPAALSRVDLIAGARLIVAVCVEAWSRSVEVSQDAPHRGRSCLAGEFFAGDMERRSTARR